MSQRQRRRRAERRKQADRHTKRRVAAGAGVALGATLAATGSAQAADFTVSNLNDSGPGSLRQAVLDSEAASGPDRILFQSGLSGSIRLTTGELNISEGLEIIGPGANILTIDASGSPGDRVFYASYFPAGETFSVSGLTLTGGSSDGTFNSPDFDNGGAIYCFDADLALSKMVISGNATNDGSGGGVSANQKLTVDSSTISGNNAAGSEGGINTSSVGQVSISNSTISGNHASGDAGGLDLSSYNGSHVVQNSTISGNSADGAGGGVYVYSNEAGTERSRFVDTTIASNSAGLGGGIASTGQGRSPKLDGTLLANNAAAAGPDLIGQAEAAFSLVRNTGAAALSQSGPNVIGADPQLGPLANNGGPTQTQALGAKSPALDKGASFGLGSDQRGVVRPIGFPGIANAAGGNGADIGAFELQPSNAFKFGKLKRNKKKGTAKQIVKLPLPDAGKVTIKGKGLKTKTRKVTGAKKVKLPVIAKGKKRKALNRSGKAKFKAKVTYSPTGNVARTLKRKLKLLKQI